MVKRAVRADLGEEDGLFNKRGFSNFSQREKSELDLALHQAQKAIPGGLTFHTGKLKL